MPLKTFFKKILFLTLVIFIFGCTSKEEKLLLAINQKDTPLVAKLIKEGANVNATDHHGSPFLHSVITAGNLDILKLFIDAKVNIEATNAKGMTALHWTAFFGNFPDTPSMAVLLIRSGANINAETESGGTRPLQLAVTQGDFNMTALFVTYGASINGQSRRGSGNTPLHLAAYLGKDKILEFLIKKGAFINTLNYYRQTPLDFAKLPLVAQNRFEMAQVNDPNQNKERCVELLTLAGAKEGKDVVLEARKIEGTITPLYYENLDYGFDVKKVDLGKEFGKVAYIDKGQGDTTLIFIHGVGRYAKYFLPQIEYFKNKTRVIALDLPGYGKSDDLKKPWKGQLHAKAIKKFVHQLNLESVVLIGHSYGSNVALNALDEIKTKVKKVVFLTLPGVQEFTQEDEKWLKENYFSKLNTHTTDKEIINYFDFILAFEKNPTTEMFLKENLGLALSGDFSNTLATRNQVALNDANLEETAKRIAIFKKAEIPMLILSGNQDRMTPAFQPAENFRPKIEDYYEDIVAKNHLCSYQLIKDCGHLLNLEKPEEVNKIIDHFVF